MRIRRPILFRRWVAVDVDIMSKSLSILTLTILVALPKHFFGIFREFLKRVTLRLLRWKIRDVHLFAPSHNLLTSFLPCQQIRLLPLHHTINRTQHNKRRGLSMALNLLFLLALLSTSINSFTLKTSSSVNMLTPRTSADVQLEIKDPVDPTALTQSKAILSELRPSTTTDNNNNDDSLSSSSCNPKALLTVAKRLGDIPAADDTNNASYLVTKQQCQEAFDGLSDEERQSLLNIHQRVKLFAEAQRKSVVDMSIEIPGGRAGHSVSPCRGTWFCCDWCCCVSCSCVCFPCSIVWNKETSMNMMWKSCEKGALGNEEKMC